MPTSSRFEERKVVRLGMNGLDALSTADAGFERRLRLARRDDWERPTPRSRPRSFSPAPTRDGRVPWVRPVPRNACVSASGSGLPPAEFVAAMLPSMFSASASSERVEEFAASVAESRPAGFLTMARASAEADLTDMLGDIDLPTLLLFGDADDRARSASLSAFRSLSAARAWLSCPA